MKFCLFLWFQDFFNKSYWSWSLLRVKNLENNLKETTHFLAIERDKLKLYFIYYILEMISPENFLCENVVLLLVFHYTKIWVTQICHSWNTTANRSLKFSASYTHTLTLTRDAKRASFTRVNFWLEVSLLSWTPAARFLRWSWASAKSTFSVKPSPTSWILRRRSNFAGKDQDRQSNESAEQLQRHHFMSGNPSLTIHVWHRGCPTTSNPTTMRPTATGRKMAFVCQSCATPLFLLNLRSREPGTGTHTGKSTVSQQWFSFCSQHPQSLCEWTSQLQERYNARTTSWESAVRTICLSPSLNHALNTLFGVFEFFWQGPFPFEPSGTWNCSSSWQLTGHSQKPQNGRVRFTGCLRGAWRHFATGMEMGQSGQR